MNVPTVPTSCTSHALPFRFLVFWSSTVEHEKDSKCVTMQRSKKKGGFISLDGEGCFFLEKNRHHDYMNSGLIRIC